MSNAIKVKITLELLPHIIYALIAPLMSWKLWLHTWSNVFKSWLGTETVCWQLRATANSTGSLECTVTAPSRDTVRESFHFWEDSHMHAHKLTTVCDHISSPLQGSTKYCNRRAEISTSTENSLLIRTLMVGVFIPNCQGTGVTVCCTEQHTEPMYVDWGLLCQTAVHHWRLKAACH